MNFKFLLSSVSIFCLVSSGYVISKTNNKVIYGDDNRKDVYEVTDANVLALADSTLGMIPNAQIKPSLDGTEYTIDGETLVSMMSLCPTEKFSNQPSAPICSGFLVAPDLVLTAGHCIQNVSDCRGHKWVFGYNLRDGSPEAISGLSKISAQEVYSCKEIIARTLDNYTYNDYALIRIDRAVANHQPLKVRTEGEVSVGDKLILIGHPSGLPTKIADGAVVRNISNPFYFSTNTDSFGGNSGSAVFNADTGLVEGILVRGETDYTYNRTKKCYMVYQCAMDKCRGEDVTRVTNVKALMDLVSASSDE